MKEVKTKQVECVVPQLTREQQHALDRTKAELDRTKTKLIDTKAELKRTKSELDDTRSTLDATRQQAATFKEDFKQERADRERNHNDLTSEIAKYQGIAKAFEEKLTQTIQQLEVYKQLDSKKLALQQKMEEEKSTLQVERCSIKDSINNLEEEDKLVLTQQVKANSHQCCQCQELKKTMLQLQEKSKTLEEQVYHKERIASEVDELKAQVQNAELKVQSALDSKQHLLAAFQQEQKKVAELEGALSSQKKTMEIEYSKLRNANKTIAEKLKEANDQLSKLKAVLPPEFLRVLYVPNYQTPSTATTMQSPSMHPQSNTYMSRPDVNEIQRKDNVIPTNISSHSKIPSNNHEAYVTIQDEQAANQGGTQVVVNPSGNVPKQLPSQAVFVSTNQPQYKEELSGGYAAPQMTAAQMQQFAIHAQRQREQAILLQQKQQQEEERLRLLEEQRIRENIKADEALRELERAEQERVKRQGVCKPGPISQASPTSNPIISNVPGIQTQDSRVGQMVGGVSEPVDNTKTSEDIPENELLENIDQEIQYYANQVRDMTKRPTTAEVDADDHSSLPYDPNLVCHKCGKRYHIGEIQKFKCHIKELCPMKNIHDMTKFPIVADNKDTSLPFDHNMEVAQPNENLDRSLKNKSQVPITEEVIQDYYKMMRRPSTNEVQENDDSSLPYDPNLVCHKCGMKYHIGEIQKFKRHIKELCLIKK